MDALDSFALALRRQIMLVRRRTVVLRALLALGTLLVRHGSALASSGAWSCRHDGQVQHRFYGEMLVVGIRSQLDSTDVIKSSYSDCTNTRELALKEYTILPPPICVHWK